MWRSGRAEQFIKAHLSMVVRPAGKSTPARAQQPRKLLGPIVVSVAGMFTVDRLPQPRNTVCQSGDLFTWCIKKIDFGGRIPCMPEYGVSLENINRMDNHKV